MLNPKSLGLAGGVLWALSIFVLTLSNIYLGYAPMWTGLIADIYPWYEVTLTGSLIGLVWGFLDAFIGLYILAWLYNKFS